MSPIDEFFSSKSILTYIAVGEIALLFTILFVTTAAKRWPKWYDGYEFIVWSLFVSVVTGCVDNNLFYSAAIGFAPQLAHKVIIQMIPDLLPNLLSLFSKAKKE